MYRDLHRTALVEEDWLRTYAPRGSAKLKDKECSKQMT